MTDTDAYARWTTWYSGNVQGVGFRYTTVQVARRFPITGYVKNLADGRVEVVAEGTSGDLRAFHEALAETMAGYIQGHKQDKSPGTREFGDFSTRH